MTQHIGQTRHRFILVGSLLAAHQSASPLCRREILNENNIIIMFAYVYYTRVCIVNPTAKFRKYFWIPVHIVALVRWWCIIGRVYQLIYHSVVGWLGLEIYLSYLTCLRPLLTLTIWLCVRRYYSCMWSTNRVKNCPWLPRCMMKISGIRKFLSKTSWRTVVMMSPVLLLHVGVVKNCTSSHLSIPLYF